MLGEEEGLSGDLTIRSSGWQSDRCGWTTRSGGSSDLSFDKSEFSHKRNQKECGKWMRRRIVRLMTPFIGWRREGRWCRGGETVDGEWSSSMLPFRREERNESHPF
jgi:hypothetical protein